MDFQQAIRAGFQKCLTFSGRSSRSEYWYWLLFWILLSCVLSFIGIASSDSSTIGSLLGLFFMLAHLSMAVRRLHDLDKTGWWVLLMLIPGLGILLLWAWFVIRGTVGQNRYGSDPLDQSITPTI